MKKLLTLLPAFIILSVPLKSQLLKKLGEKVKTKSAQRADQKVDAAIDKGLNKTEDASKKRDDSVNEDKENGNAKQQVGNTGTIIKNADSTPAASFKVYNNYDFVPGDKILFEDNFTGDRDGEFPAHWELKNGQSVLNKVNGEMALLMTDGNYARVLPRMKTDKYLKDTYTIEFDWYYKPGAYGIIVMLGFYDKKEGFSRESEVQIRQSEAYFSGTSGNVGLTKSYNEELAENISNRWHHVAIAIKNHQLKLYIDQYRMLVVPDTKEDYDNIQFASIGSEESPVIFKNVRIASGGDMNMIGKKFTDTKIVTHGINFDFNKATIKPESMGTLNMIVQVMKDNAEIKFEVGGHTDGDGADNYNLKLSEQRAIAVKEQLIKMGIDSSRLTATGYGRSKPISDNTSPEGKANNRRVEFVKF